MKRICSKIIIVIGFIVLICAIIFYLCTENRRLDRDIENTLSIESISENPVYTLTLVADSSQAILNGRQIALHARPFVKNNTFFIPLEEVVTILGGSYSIEKNVATIKLFGSTTEYQKGSNEIRVNGEKAVISGDRTDFSTEHNSVKIDYSFSPIIVDSIFYIPNGLVSYTLPNGLTLSKEYPEANMIILGNAPVLSECGVAEVKLNDEYETLSENFKDSMRQTSNISEVLNYYVDKYENDKIHVYVLRSKKTNDDPENMDGKVCAIKVTEAGYTTSRGLTTGMSAYQAYLRYGEDSLNYSFSYVVKFGVVDSFSFFTRYCSG